MEYAPGETATAQAATWRPSMVNFTRVEPFAGGVNSTLRFAPLMMISYFIVSIRGVFCAPLFAAFDLFRPRLAFPVETLLPPRDRPCLTVSALVKIAAMPRARQRLRLLCLFLRLLLSQKFRQFFIEPACINFTTRKIRVAENAKQQALRSFLFR